MITLTKRLRLLASQTATPSCFAQFFTFAALLLLGASAVQAAVVDATFTSAASVPVSASSYTATGNTVNFTLSYAPVVGTVLTVVQNTGLPFISGRFTGLAQGDVVNLSFSGTTYPFVANYYGGTGNDLVLHWAGTKPAAWGSNLTSQLGQDSGTVQNLYRPQPLTMPVGLADKTVIAASAGLFHSLALFSDGSLAAWGANFAGQLGLGSSSTVMESAVPLPVPMTGAFAGKTVIAIGAGGLTMWCCSPMARWRRGAAMPQGSWATTAPRTAQSPWRCL